MRRVVWLALLGSVGLMGLVGLSACGEDEHDHEEVTDATTAIWEQIYEERSSGKADGGVECSGVIVPDQGDFAGRVALTFDDGPNAATTPRVLDILKNEGIHATFFINGNRVRGAEEEAILKRILDEGHILANHSQSHKDFRTELTLDEARAQISRTDAIIAQAGEDQRYFRFPYGSSNCSTATLARDFGYTITGWHIDSADWCFAAERGGAGYCHPRTFRWVPDEFRGDMVAYTLSQVRSKNGGILLFHDIHQNTVNNLQPIINGLRERGYTFANVDDRATFPKLNGVRPPFVGDVCAEAADCAFTANGVAGDCHAFVSEDTGAEAPDTAATFGFCTLKCEGFCPDSAGKAPTFCASLDDGLTGSCLSKAGDRNQDCAAIPGTAPKELDRFIGASNAPPSTATVCFPAQ